MASQESINTEIIIVGAGPTGLAIACQLIRHGVDFLIIDQKEGTTPYSKAIGVQARTLEIYEQIGLANRLIARGTPIKSVRLLEGGEERAVVPLSELGEGQSPYPYVLIVEQGQHEQLLHGYIREHGKNVLWHSKLENFSQHDKGVSATIIAADGHQHVVEAKYLVACDGAKSSVRKKLGLMFEGSTFERLFYVADVEMDWKFSYDMLTACLGKDRSTAFFPMPGVQHQRIVGVFPESFSDKDETQIPFHEIERQIFEDTNLELTIKNVNWFSTYRVHSRRVNKFSEGRCFLAGDSAHIHSPAGAQGMNTGIQDGYNLAWKLAMVLRENAAPKLLDSYNEERIKVAERLLETTDRIFDLLVSPEWLLSFIRLNIFPYVAKFAVSLDSVNQFVFPLISQIGISYRRSSLSGDDDGHFDVKAGDRMPYFLIEGKSIYDSLHRPVFHLLTFTNDKTDSAAIAKGISDTCAEFVEHRVFPLSDRVAEIFGTNEPFNVLLRPDNYVGFVSREISFDRLRAYLNDVLGFEGQTKAGLSQTM